MVFNKEQITDVGIATDWSCNMAEQITPCLNCPTK